MRFRVLATVLSLALATTVSSVAIAAPAAANEAGVITGTPSSMWQTNGTVRALAFANGKIFVGGEFTTTRPPGSPLGTNETPRNYLAAYDSTTGALLTAWNPAPNNKVWSLTTSPDGTKLYVGGDFTTISGVGRTRMAMYSTSGSMVIDATFKPSASYRVMKTAMYANTLYMAGAFSTVNNVARSRAAAVNATTGALLPWDPNVTSDSNAAVQTQPDVPAIAVSNDGSKVYLGGRFYFVHGIANYGFAVVDPITGVPGSLPAQSALPYPTSSCVSGPRDIIVDNNNFYVSNAGDGGGCFDGTFSGKVADGSLIWKNTCLGATEQVILIKGWLYKGSHAHDCSSMNDFPQHPNRFLLVENPATGALGPWSPQTNAAGSTQVGPLAFATDGNQLFVGGDFTTVANVGQQGITRYGLAASAPPSVPATPVAVATGTGTVGISFNASYDVDDSTLTYQLFRSDNSTTPIKTITMKSRFWDIPGTDYVDTGLTVGAKYSYRIVVSDGTNTVSSASSSPVTVSSGVQPYPTIIKSDGAINYWRFGESSGTAATDIGRLTNPGTYNGGITLGQPGVLPGDGAASFNGANGTYVSTTNLTDTPGPENFSAEAWIKTTTTTGGEIISFGNSQTGQSSSYDRQIYMTNDGHVVWGIYNNQISVITSSSLLNDGNWHHLVGTYQPGVQSFFVDGVQQGTLLTPFAQAVRGWWRIGGDNLGGWPGQPSTTSFTGTIDEPAVYSYALPAAAVGRHFKAAGGNLAPVAAFTPTCTLLSCHFDGSAAADPDGSIKTYAWNFGDGGTSAAVSPDHAYGAHGTYTVSLTVTDNSGSTNILTKTVVATLPPPSDHYGSVVAADSPSIYWRLDESSGTTAADIGTSANDGTYYGGVTQGQPGAVSGTTDTSTGFDGSSGGVGATTPISDPTTYSEESWFKTSTTTGGKIMGFGNQASGTSSHYDRHVYMSADGKLNFGVYNGQLNVVTSPSAYNDDAWHHVVATQGPGGMVLYVDGQSVGTDPQTSQEIYDGFWRIGGDSSWSGSNYFNGQIDEVAFYAIVLSSSQVAAHYTAGTLPAAPVARADSGSTSFNTPLNVAAAAGVLSNDTGRSLAVTTNTAPSHGTIAIVADGSYTYTPTNNYVGTDSFSYTATDSGGQTATATVTITVEAPAAPTANADSGVASFQTPLVVGTPGVLGNDIASNPIVSAHTTPAHGTVTIAANGAYTYTPASGYVGVDSFTYTLTDAAGQDATATVSLRVTPPGVPTANDDSGSTNYQTRLTVAAAQGVLVNDTGTGLTVTANTDPAHGSATVNADGSFTYTPASGFSGSDSFGYTVTDAASQHANATVTVTVAAAPPAPVASDDTATTPFQTPVTAAAPGVLNNDSGSGVTVTAHTTAAHGSVMISADGGYTYTPSAGFAGVDSFTYTVTDTFGRTSIGTVTITVTAPPAPIANDDADSATYQTVLTSPAPGVLRNDTGTGITVTAHTGPTHGSLTINGDGSYSYTPAHGYVGADSFTYTITDALNRTATATDSLTVTASGGPVAADDQATTAYEKQIAVAAPGLLANDTGTDIAVTSNVMPQHGAATVKADGSYSYTPAAGYAGSDWFTYIITDSLNRTATATVYLTVTAPAAPTAGNDTASTPYETTLTVAKPGVMANDSGTDITVTSNSAPAHGTATVKADGSYVYSPTAGYSGPDSFTYTVTDAVGRTATASVAVTVVAPPGAPVANADSGSTAYQTVLTVPATSGVLTNDTGSGLTVTSNTAPAHGTASVTSNGAYTYTPAANYAGADSFTYTVTDSVGRTATATVSVSVSTAPSLLLAQDTFARTVSGGWGTATMGGVWGPNNASFSVNGSKGVVTLAAGNNRSMFLTTLGSVRDVNALQTVDMDKLPGGSGLYSSITLRRPTASTVTAYRGTFRVQSNGKVTGLIYKSVAGTETTIGAETIIAGITATPGTQYSVRFSAVGASPTALALTIWKAGTTEPAPQLTVTDSTPELQAAGLVGVVEALSSTSTVAPVLVSVDSFEARKPS